MVVFSKEKHIFFVACCFKLVFIVQTVFSSLKYAYYLMFRFKQKIYISFVLKSHGARSAE